MTTNQYALLQWGRGMGGGGNNKKQYTQKAAIINSEISANTLRNKRKYTQK